LKTPYELISWKKQGREHSAEEIAALVDAITDGSIPEYQLAAWLMAVWFRGMSVEETYQLTERMASSGIRLDLSELSGPTADKHSTGGVGDKVSLLLAPLAAELGLSVPMLSGRGLGHTGGTLDKLQSIPGYRIDLSPREFLQIVGTVGCSITGQTGEIAPADRRLYHLRDVTDLKCGSGAFMRDPKAARILAESLLATATRAGRKICALITDMGQPLGSAVGHALEAQEAIEGLSGRGPEELRSLTIELTAAMGELAGLGSLQELRKRCAQHLDDGSALRRFLAMVHAHGGRMDENAPASCFSIAPEAEPLLAANSGWVQPMDAEQIGLSLVELGGARRRSDDELDLGVGLKVLARVGDKVDQGQPLVSIFARDEGAATACRERLRVAMPVTNEKCAPTPLIFERVG